MVRAAATAGSLQRTLAVWLADPLQCEQGMMNSRHLRARLVGALAIGAIASGCLRLDVGSGDPVLAATPLSDPDSIVHCAMAVAPAPDTPDFAVLWQEYAVASRQFLFARVSRSGKVVSGPTLVATSDSSSDRLWLYPHGEGYIAFFLEGGSISALALGPDGTPTRARVDAGFYSSTATLTSGDDGFGLFYTQEYEIHYRPLDPQGLPAGEARVAMELPADRSPTAEGQAVAFLPGSGYHVVWSEAWGAELGHGRLGADGAWIRTSFMNFGSHHGVQAASDGDGRVVLSWIDDEGQLTLHAIDGDGGPASGLRRVSLRNRRESLDYAIAGSDGRVAVAWESDAEVVLPQILLAVNEADGSGTVQPLNLTEHDYGFSCPAIARAEGATAVAFRGAVRGSQRLYLEVIAD
jgi:hypothetical protein